jgi:hypothetical protein
MMLFTDLTGLKLPAERGTVDPTSQMLREPRLLLKNARPIGLVKSSLKERTVLATLFRSSVASNGLYCPLTLDSTNYIAWSHAGLEIGIGSSSSGNAITPVLPINIGSGDFTFLMDLTFTGTDTSYIYFAGGSYSSGFSFYYLHFSEDDKWGVLVGGSYYTPTNATVLPLGAPGFKAVFGFSRCGSIMRYALNGVNYGERTFTGSPVLNNFTFNTYSPTYANGLSKGTYHQAILATGASSLARLAELTDNTSLWWEPV